MKTFRLHKVVTLVAALALASAGIAGDALARGGGGGGGGGGGHGGGGFGGGAPALGGNDNPAGRHEGIGIWKAFVPRGVKGEFDNYDPVGLMAGALIKADCSLNWRDPDSGKLYCFASGTSQVYFQDWPKTYIRKAGEAYERLAHPKPGS